MQYVKGDRVIINVPEGHEIYQRLSSYNGQAGVILEIYPVPWESSPGLDPYTIPDRGTALFYEVEIASQDKPVRVVPGDCLQPY